MKRFISLLLVAIMLLTAFVACGEGEDGKDSGNASGDTDNVQDSDHTSLNLPDNNYGGREFRILGKGKNTSWTSFDLTAEELTSDPVNNAIYFRNLKMQEEYGITVVEYGVADGTNQQSLEAMTSCGAGSDDYDMFCLSPLLAGAPLITNSYLMDLTEMPNMNLDAEWYDHNSIEQLSIADRVYLTTGSMLLMDDYATGAIVFSKYLAQVNGLPNFYDMVGNGTWTIDEMRIAAEVVANDTDGNGQIDYMSDTWGCLTENDVILALVAGAGERIARKDENDEPYSSAATETYATMLDKIFQMINEPGLTIHAQDTGVSDPWTDIHDVAFKENRALFNIAWLNRAVHFRSMETDFGILPYPKLNADQKDYYSFVSLWAANTISVPITCSDTDFVSFAIEALSYESKYGHNSLDEAFYTKTLEAKGVRDEESLETLKIVQANTVFDIGYMFNWGGLASSIIGLRGTAGGNAQRFASTLASLSKRVNSDIEKTMNAVYQQ